MRAQTQTPFTLCTVQVTNYLPDEDLTWLTRERARIRRAGCDVRIHSDAVLGHALWRAPHRDEQEGHCHVCSAVWFWRTSRVHIPRCPTCARAGRAGLSFSFLTRADATQVLDLPGDSDHA